MTSGPTILDASGKALPDFEAFYPPDLKHTKVLSASFNGQPIEQPTWKQLVHTAITHAFKITGDVERVEELSEANIVQGRRNDCGYRYVRSIDVSVQGQDANNAWRSVSYIARNLKVPVEVSFVWRNEEGAARPGKKGTMRIHG